MKSTVKLAAFLVLALTAMNFAAMAATPKAPNFFARRDYPGAPGVSSEEVQIGDTNGDGIPDMITENGGYIQVLFGNDDGTFRTGPFTNIPIGSPYAFSSLDVNGDGIKDLVLLDLMTQNGTTAVAVCLGKGDGTFSSATLYQGVSDTLYEIAIGDFNGDSILDVAAIGKQGVWLFTGQGDGTFMPGVLAAPLQSAIQYPLIAAGDLNGDNKLDLAV